MKNKTMILFLAVLLIASASFAGTIRSQGSAGAAQLLIPVGAESIALSSANVATVSGVEAIFLNPAGVAKYKKAFQGTASTMTYIADIDQTYIGFITNMGQIGSFGLSIKSLDFGEIPVTTADATEGTGEMYSPRFMALTANYSKSFADRVQFGANFKVVSEQIINTKATGLCIDLGVQYRFADLPVTFGVVLRNLGPRMEYSGSDMEQALTPAGTSSGTLQENFRVKSESFELPAMLDISANYEVFSGLNLMGSFRNNSFATNYTSFGAKYNYGNLAWVAGGTTFSLVEDTQEDGVSDADWEDWYTTPWGLTFGAGVNVPVGTMKLGVAYSVRTVTNYFENNNTVQLTLEF
ncbi:MAG: PorV/PorQ family protein [Candidatus Neomarinimicrobiota bacterium]